jgi:flagellar hook protein FlgE
MGFQQGLSGLNAASKNLDVIGNNVANSSTVGFKASRAEFEDIYAAALNGAGVNKVGIGVNLAGVAQQFTQGSISTTDNPLDLAINGPGFFQLTDGLNPVVYSRNGQFKVNREGFIVNNDDLRLLGYPADGAGVIQPGIAGPLQLPTAGIAPARTNDIKLEFNVDSRVPVTLPAAGGIVLTVYFQKASVDPATGDTTWNVYATANGTPVAVDSAGNPIALDAANNPTAPWQQIVFPRDGGQPTFPVGLVNLDIPASVNAQGAPVLDVPGIQVNLSGANENGSAFAVTNVVQDGYAPGQLAGILIEAGGIVTARYSNGQSKPAGQLEMANFRNPQGLQPLGGNVWGRTFGSGDAILGTPNVGNFGALQAGALEDSNTDLTLELVNMITAQRVYQANAQTIRTQDQVLQTIVQLR